MSTTQNPADLQTFIVVATIRDDTNFSEFQALVPDEQRQMEVLRSQGRMGFDHISIGRGTAFVEVIATDEEAVGETMATLPLFKFFDIDVYPTAPPGPPQAATAA